MIHEQIFGLIGYVTTSTVGGTLIKLYIYVISMKFDFKTIFSLINPDPITGVILYLIGFLIWYYHRSQMKLSIAYPISITLSIIGVIVAPVLILRKKISVDMIIGNMNSLFGITLFTRNF